MADTAIPDPSPTADPLAAGRAALARHAWQEAFDRLSEADRLGLLGADDLEALASASFFAARADLELEASERAFARHEADGNDLRAAYLAAAIARTYGHQGKAAIARAWQRRAERLIGADGETYAHGYLALAASESAAAQGQLDAALSLAERAIEIGANAADPDLTAFAQSNLGTLKIATGDMASGFALMEEASLAAVNGELTPFTSGITACQMISACRDVTDYRRATEWIEATEKYCVSNGLAGFPGVCRIHRAEVAAIGGAWEQAEQELERLTGELEPYLATPPQADGFYAIGDIRRLKGDFEGAEAALREAHLRGRSPQPALALVRLAQGNIRAAAKAIDAAVNDTTWDRLTRARLLPAQVEIALAASDLDRARSAATELSEIVAGYPLPALEAGERLTRGRLLLAEGDAAAAARELRLAIKGWQDVGAPYEVARARRLLSRALRGLEDDDDADLELHAAIQEFDRLGAHVDAESAGRERRQVAEHRSDPTTARRTFMFTDIVGSTSLAEALGDDAWERLLRWHDDMLRTLIGRAGGQIVNSTGDGFFVAFDSAQTAVETAIAVQRALRDHRERTGFALQVRIGLHTAEATLRGADYSGLGVHVAARIGALASGGEILATSATLEQAGDVATTDARSVTVRGVASAVEIATIPWR
ncbi:MAG TPA: adenylate/guanylate cyclase domain-containing protein [Candidatus Limnocylindrales bacterium]|nr:adenylate/guanylate cyclase domain-containing protein [Candidatus Limnocylindrales bacterium]